MAHGVLFMFLFWYSVNSSQYGDCFLSIAGVLIGSGSSEGLGTFHYHSSFIFFVIIIITIIIIDIIIVILIATSISS